MHHLEFFLDGKGTPPRREHALAGVVGSGNLEVLLERAELGGTCKAIVNTSVDGYEKLWERVLADFVARHRFADLCISINDGGATPAVVTLRLEQAAAELNEGAE